MKVTKLERLISQICDIKSQKEKFVRDQVGYEQAARLRDTEKELIYNIYFLLCGDGDFSFIKYDKLIEEYCQKEYNLSYKDFKQISRHLKLKVLVDEV